MSAWVERVTLYYSFKPQKKTSSQSVLFHRLQAVLGTRGGETAYSRKVLRTYLVGFYYANK
jgi:uncharacterized membrane protein